MNGIRPISELSDVNAARFNDEVRRAGRPVIFRELARNWPAVTAAREGDAKLVEYVKQFVTTQPVIAVVGQPKSGGRFFYNEDMTEFNFERGTSPLPPLLDRLLKDAHHPAPLTIAVQSEPIPNLLPGFERSNATDFVPSGTVPRAWLGNRVRVGIHADMMENLGVVVAGRRRFTLFPPDQVGNLYLGPFELTPAGTPVSLVDLAEPDFARFPRFADALAAAEVAELDPGDAIYIPYHWWHAVDSLAPVNLFVNYWWTDPGPQTATPPEALMHAFLAFRELPADQLKVWQSMFDHYVFRANGDPAEHLPPHARGMLGKLDEAMTDKLIATLVQTLSR